MLQLDLNRPVTNQIAVLLPSRLLFDPRQSKLRFRKRRLWLLQPERLHQFVKHLEHIHKHAVKTSTEPCRLIRNSSVPAHLNYHSVLVRIPPKRTLRTAMTVLQHACSEQSSFWPFSSVWRRPFLSEATCSSYLLTCSKLPLFPVSKTALQSSSQKMEKNVKTSNFLFSIENPVMLKSLQAWISRHCTICVGTLH